MAKLPVPDFEAKMGGIVVTVYRKTWKNGELNDRQKATKKDHVVDHVVENVVENVVDNRLSKIINLIKNNNQISANKIAKLLGITSRTAQRDLEKLTKQKRIKRKGSERGGYWEIINE